LHKSEVVLSVPLPSHYHSSKEFQPGKKTFNLPPSAITTQPTAILSGGERASAPAFGSDQADATLNTQPLRERTTVKGFVSDQDRRECVGECCIEGLLDKPNIVSRAISNGD